MEINRVVTISWNCYGTQIDNRARNTEGAGGQLPPKPNFCRRSVNPIPMKWRGVDYAHHITTRPHEFWDLPSALDKYVVSKDLQIWVSRI